MSDTDMAYVAHCPRGHFIGCVVDRPEHAKDTASMVADWIRRGASIQRLTVDEIRPMIDFDNDHQEVCEGKKPRAKKTQQGALL